MPRIMRRSINDSAKKSINSFQSKFGLDAVVYDVIGNREFSYDPDSTQSLFKIGKEIDISKIKMLAAICGYDSFITKKTRSSGIPDILLDDLENPILEVL